MLREHGATLLLGTFAAVAVFVVFYLMTVFTLTLGHQQARLLAAGIPDPADDRRAVLRPRPFPLSAWLADRFSPRRVLIVASRGHGACSAWLFAPLLQAGQPGSVLLCLALGLGLMGVAYGPLGAALAALFPTAVRYTGASLTFNLAGIVGASLTPYVATWLATRYGLAAVGYYLSIAALLTLVRCCCCRVRMSRADRERQCP